MKRHIFFSLLRGLFNKGVMQGSSLLKDIPLDRLASERSAKLWIWLTSWWSKDICPPLQAFWNISLMLVFALKEPDNSLLMLNFHF